MVSTILLAAMGGLAATTTTAVATGDASGVASAAAHAVPPGLQVALSHVPSASHAFEVLKTHLALYAQTGSAGTAATGGVAAAAKHGLHLGLGK
jgi:hypothetical protein